CGLGDRDAQARVLEGAEGVIRMAAEDRLHQLDLPGRIALEALVRIQDRPAFRVTGDSVDIDDPLAGDWAPFLGLVANLPDWTRSVGRIDLDGIHIGSGFLIGGGQVMTNRHVLEACADELTGPGGTLWRFDRGAVTIDFSETADGSQCHALTGVVMAGPDPIGGVERLGHLDMALLSLDAAEMVVIGYPARDIGFRRSRDRGDQPRNRHPAARDLRHRLRPQIRGAGPRHAGTGPASGRQRRLGRQS
ncbi:hypothetical protein LZ189_19910, partial [Rhodovulum sulfidophilum]|nr:hypothetical protein [Rhodovulum sulfidophilum]